MALSVHHSQIKKASALGLTISISGDGNQAHINYEGTLICAAEDAKAALAEAERMLQESGYEDYADLASDIAEEAEAEADPDAEDVDESRGSSVVPPKYRKLYREVGVKGRDCGDAHAQAFADAVGDAEGDELVVVLAAVAVANDLDLSRWAGLNFGQQRMCLSNVLRGRVRRGLRVVIGGAIFNPDADAPEAVATKRKTKAADSASKTLALVSAKLV